MSEKITGYGPAAQKRAREQRREYRARSRKELRKAGLCIDCKRPSTGWRCPFHQERDRRLKRKASFRKWLKDQQKNEIDQGSR